jgi:amino acid permease
MKLGDIILLSLAFVFFIIGVHQIMTLGFMQGYWAMMVFIVFYFWFNYRKKKNQEK